MAKEVLEGKSEQVRDIGWCPRRRNKEALLREEGVLSYGAQLKRSSCRWRDLSIQEEVSWLKVKNKETAWCSLEAGVRVLILLCVPAFTVLISLYII